MHGAHVACGAWLALAACTELAPGSDRLDQTVVSNLPDAGADLDPRWACLEEPSLGGADRLVPTVELTLAVTDTVTGTTPAALNVRACAKLDVSCSTPLTAAVGIADDGLVHLTVRQGFDGFVELTSPNIISTLYFLNRPLMRDSAKALATVSTVALGALAAQGNVTLDPTLGHVLVRAFDCFGDPAAGVELWSDVGGLPFVIIAGLPSVGVQVTTEAGVGGFVNVPVGYAVLDGRWVAGDRRFGTANVVVRQGWFTYGDVEPQP